MIAHMHVTDTERLAPGSSPPNNPLIRKNDKNNSTLSYRSAAPMHYALPSAPTLLKAGTSTLTSSAS
jgi:hypothetical protein